LKKSILTYFNCLDHNFNMVFGWGTKKEKKQEMIESAPQEKQISLSDVDGIIQNLSSLRIKTIIAEVRSFKSKIEYYLIDLTEIANKLEKDDLKTDDVDRHLKILVIRGKKMVISAIQSESKNKLPNIESYDDVLQFNKITTKMLKKIGDVLGRQSRVIHIFAKKYVNKLKGTMELLTSEQKTIQTLIDNQLQLEVSIKQIQDNQQQLHECEKMTDGKNQRILELKNSIEQYDEETKNTQKTLDKIKASENYTKFVEQKNKLDLLSSEKNQIRSDIDLQFIKISRPLNKYQYVSALEKSQKKILQDLVKNAIDVINSENKKDIEIILNAVKKAVQSGSISVKDNEKSISGIDETISTLDRFIMKISDFNEKRTKLEESLKIFDLADFQNRESLLDKLQNNKTDAENKIQIFTREIDDYKQKISDLFGQIEKSLQTVSAIKYSISK